MKIRIEGRLAYVGVSLTHRGRVLELDHVVLDTGSAATLFSADEVAKIGLLPGPDDVLYCMVGVGGEEFVFSKALDTLTVGDLELNDVRIQVGAMEYGFPVQGLIGLDFLLRSRADIDLGNLELRQALPQA